MSCESFKVSYLGATVHSLNYVTAAQNTYKTLLGLPPKPVSCILSKITAKVDLIFRNGQKLFSAK